MIEAIEVKELYKIEDLPFNQVALVYAEGRFVEGRLYAPSNLLAGEHKPTIIRIENQVGYYELHEVDGWIPLLKYTGECKNA